MSKLRVLELFGGIGACTAAMKRLDIDFEVVDYVEIDKYAVASYNAINGTNFEPQDICEWDKGNRQVEWKVLAQDQAFSMKLCVSRRN